MPAWTDTLIFGLTLFFMLVGLFGLLVPLFPGITVIWLAALVYGLVKGFAGLGGWMFALITLLMLAGVTVDNLLAGAGARQGGAAWSSLFLGSAAGLIGTLVFPPLGGVIALLLVILLLEYRRQRDWHKVFATLRGLAAGWGLSFVVRFGIGILMVIAWVIWDWKG